MSPTQFIGPDGICYDASALPRNITRKYGRLYFRSDTGTTYSAVGWSRRLPASKEKWSVMRASNPPFPVVEQPAV